MHNSANKAYTTTKALNENIVKTTEASSISRSLPTNDYNMGDVNLDGIVDTNDVAAILKEYASVSTGNKASFNDIQIKNADLNMDTQVDVSDACELATKILQESSDK